MGLGILKMIKQVIITLTNIHFLRFLSLTWVIAGHVYSSWVPYGHSMTNNMLIYKDWFKDGAMGAIFNAFPSVDTFFFIGALLLTFLTLKELDKAKDKGIGYSIGFWIKFYVHRYIRLTGVYAIILGFHATLLKLFATGPVSKWMTEAHDLCQEHWWQNLLYINNFYYDESMMSCMGVTWYLAVDMQMFIIAPLVIWPLWKFPKIGLGVAGALTTAGQLTEF